LRHNAHHQQIQTQTHTHTHTHLVFCMTLENT